jgi:hypothetical protein
MGDPISVEKDDPKDFVTLQDVKADDLNNIKRDETAPDQTELQTALENDVRNDLVQKVLLQVQELPHQIYEVGKSREQEENDDGAGEYYLRFLSCTTENGTAEREHAKVFLAQKFNMHVVGGVAPQ